MKTESENLSAQQSLEIITAMIKQAQGTVRKNGFHFLLWGWVIVIANLGMYTLTKMNYPYPFAIWAITLPAWLISIYKGYKDGKSRHASTHLDKISLWLWVCFGICIFTLVGFGYKLNYQLNPLILTVSAIPTFISGIVVRFKPLMLGGIAFWISGIIGFLVPMDTQPLIGAIAIVCGYLVPGYLLKYQND